MRDLQYMVLDLQLLFRVLHRIVHIRSENAERNRIWIVMSLDEA